jgi:hypothetical protein
MKRGPKGYDNEDRPFRIAALELMLDERASPKKAAMQVGTEHLAGFGTLENRQRRLRGWLKRHGGSRTAIELSLMYERIILDTGTKFDYSGILLQKGS